MNPKVASTLKYVAGIGVGIALLYYAFRNISLSQISENLTHARWEWLIFSMLFSILSHFLRGVRWRMQLKASGYNLSVPTTFSAVLFTYLVNLAFPRAGEVARCSAVYQSDNVPVTTSLGTVVTERIIDVFMLGIMVLISFGLASQTLLDFIQKALASKSGGGSGLFIIAGIGVMGALIGVVFRKKIIQTAIYQKIKALVLDLIQSAWSVTKLERPGLFVALSVAIWFCYWMMMYVGLYCFEPIAAQSSHISLLKFAFLGTMLGSFGMALPIPGGTGPYHSAIIFAFVGFAVFPDPSQSETWGAIFALVFHAAQTLVMIVGGALGYVYILTRKKATT